MGEMSSLLADNFVGLAPNASKRTRLCYNIIIFFGKSALNV